MYYRKLGDRNGHFEKNILFKAYKIVYNRNQF